MLFRGEGQGEQAKKEKDKETASAFGACCSVPLTLNPNICSVRDAHWQPQVPFADSKATVVTKVTVYSKVLCTARYCVHKRHCVQQGTVYAHDTVYSTLLCSAMLQLSVIRYCTAVPCA